MISGFSKWLERFQKKEGAKSTLCLLGAHSTFFFAFSASSLLTVSHLSELEFDSRDFIEILSDCSVELLVQLERPAFFEMLWSEWHGWSVAQMARMFWDVFTYWRVVVSTLIETKGLHVLKSACVHTDWNLGSSRIEECVCPHWSKPKVFTYWRVLVSTLIET